MIYIEILGNNEIGLVHFQPFDEVRGLKKTESELLQTGILVEQLPEPLETEGLIPVLMFNGVDLYYDYVQKTPSEEDLMMDYLVDVDYRVTSLELGL